MIKKNTLLMITISIILVIIFVFLQQYNVFEKLSNNNTSTTPTQSNWLDINVQNISRITFEMSDQDAVLIQRMSDADWIVNNGSGFITPGKVEELVSEFNAIRPLLILADVPDSSATGLDNPGKVLSIEFENDENLTIKIGSLNPLQTGYYAQINDDEIVLISTGSVENITNIFIAASLDKTQESDL